MTNFKTMLLAATALTMFSGAALAQNFSNNVQSGNNNAYFASQGGGNGNQAGTPTDAIFQNGSNNDIDIVQGGNNNRVGTAGSGVEQGGNTVGDIRAKNNVLEITQTTNSNYVNQVVQETNNTTTIDQNGGDGNVVTRISQQRGADGGTGERHTITIVQTGTGQRIGGGSVTNALSTDFGIEQSEGNSVATLTQNGGNYNRIGRVNQKGGDNTVTVRQTGSQNVLDLVDQQPGTGGGNTITATFSGDRNGAGAVVGSTSYRNAGAFTGSAAAGVVFFPTAGMSNNPAGQGDLVQQGSDNEISYAATGNDNLFAIQQIGDGNDALGVVEGSSNELAILHNGSDNRTDYLQDGDDNVAGVSITGSDNGSSLFGVPVGGVTNGQVSQSGNRNSVDIDIRGNDNDYATVQDGNDNEIVASLTGNFNEVAIRQLNGSDNSVNLSLNGSFNNTRGFTGDAASIDATQVREGLIDQLNGNFNEVDLVVSTDLNSFGFRQDGSFNVIDGTINTGTGNQAAVLQTGNANVATFVQSGMGNNIGISQ